MTSEAGRREREKVRVEELSNSCPLSHWTLRMVRPNYVDTKAKKWERVGKVLDFWHSRKVYE
jgi:hypothetical protein